MSILVVDASVAAKWFFEEQHSDAAQEILDNRYQLHVPDFFSLEMDSIIAKRIRRGEIQFAEGQHIRNVLSTFPVQHHPTQLIADSAFELAHKTHRSVYDCLYLALTMLLQGCMITADHRFYTALQSSPLSSALCWVESPR